MNSNALKVSRFNHMVSKPDGTALGYNFLWRSLVLLDKNESPAFEKLIRSQNDFDVESLNTVLDFSLLKKLRFLIPSTFDEIEFFKKSYEKSIARPVLTTMILPTLRCNFDCPYCFEFKHDVDLSDETSDAIKSWVRSRLHDKRHFHITWFGGEPLLAKSRIEELSTFGIDQAHRLGIKFSSSITTNGYLLDPETVGLLQRLQVNNVHITLDGDEDAHNTTRYLIGGGPSFDRLVENIEMYCRVSKSHLPLSIRVNVTDNNFDGISKLLKRFSQTVKRGSRVYFRWVWANEASGFQQFVVKQKRPFEKLALLYGLAADEGFIIDNPVDDTQFNYCEVDFEHHFTIDPRGYIYLCSHKFDPSEAIGHVIDDPNVESDQFFEKWISANPFGDSRCLDCKCLPICKGGCRKARVFGSKACIEERFSMDKYVESQYSKHKVQTLYSGLTKSERSDGNASAI
ncbi:MAG: radical SAM protein [Leptothrix ochracea]|uniref:radical SAM/SPASM domain-containing protein n=1 Tax=Leptothrix ochracea TaxID=735331 RepID=UPI0034E25985